MLGPVSAGWPVPLAAIHLLWINLVRYGFPSLALAAEPVPNKVLSIMRKPSAKQFFDRQFNYELIFVSIVTTVLALAVYGYSLETENALIARTHVFSFLVFSELFRSEIFRECPRVNCSVEHAAQGNDIDDVRVNSKTHDPSCELVHHHQTPVRS
jgi:magnesium-transporting ATPase (P-type)